MTLTIYPIYPPSGTSFSTGTTSLSLFASGGRSPTPTPSSSYTEGYSLRIYVSCNNYPNDYIDCWCTRWQEGNWDVTIETFMKSGARDHLFDNLVPGAVRESYNILGTPTYKDTTYTSSNTLILEPIHGYGLSSVRERRIIAVKRISDKFINYNYFGIKVEGNRLDT